MPTDDVFCEEIGRDQRVHVRFDKVFPCNRWLVVARYGRRARPVLNHDIACRCLAYEDAQFLEFTAYTTVAPGVVFAAKPMHKSANGFGNAAPARALESCSFRPFAPRFCTFQARPQ